MKQRQKTLFSKAPRQLAKASLLFIGSLSLPGAPQVIIKADDVGNRGGRIEPAWQRFVDLVEAKDMQASIGIVTDSLESDNAAFLGWIREQHDSGRIEFWHHGYDHSRERGVDKPTWWEFRNTDYAQQKFHIERGMKLAKEKLGIIFHTFGAPYNANDATTVKVLEENPDLRIWLYPPNIPSNMLRLERIGALNIERPVGVVNFQPFARNYPDYVDEDVLVLQCHPANWDESSWLAFEQIVDFLKGEGATFTTPAAYFNIGAKRMRHSADGSVPAPDPVEVKAITKRVADWQIKTFDATKEHRGLSSRARRELAAGNYEVKDYHPTDWHFGALYTGYDEWIEIADEPSKYANFLREVLEPYQWELYGEEIYDNSYHADTHLVGLTYLSLYERFGNERMIAPLRETFDFIMENPQSTSLEYGWDNTKKVQTFLLRWGWCDALFMAPPVWARLARVTGEASYRNFMDREYRATYEVLWSEDYHLFYRDTRFFERFEANGKPVFWSRGNGWVFGGLALMLPDLPQDWESRPFYTETFQQMAGALKDLQRPDGTWSMGLLGDATDYPVKETSGTAFITFGMAWGVNAGLLDPEVFQPIIYKAWSALTGAVTDEGLVGYVQPVGASPGDSFPDKTEVYGIGAFLLAGTEVYKMVAEEAGLSPRGGAVDLPEVTTFMENGGWCWFQDPRAVIHGKDLFIGAVQGNGSGPALVGVYDLEAGKPLGSFLMQDNFQSDDHNSPVFHVRPDGSVLATYAKHGSDSFHYSRISDPRNPLLWSDEFKHERSSPNARDRVTYMNLYGLKDAGLLYNFYRSIDYNPTLVTSNDDGLSWSEPVHFFQNEVGGRQRPYARYHSNGKDTIYVTATDAHPRQFGNHLYYFEYRDGHYYKADGTLIKNLAEDGALRPSEAEKIYEGSGEIGPVRAADGSQRRPTNAAWTSSIGLDAQGHPHIGYSVHLSPDDLRYRIASWDGSQWNDREVAFAGKCLYLKETSYTGLITLDPDDPSRVYISTDVHPTTGLDFGGYHEIYTAQIRPGDSIKSIDWRPITANSPVGNIRPVIATGESGGKVLLWMSGDYYNYQHYHTDVKGLVLEH